MSDDNKIHRLGKVALDTNKSQLLDHMASMYDEFVADGTPRPVFAMVCLVNENGEATMGWHTVGEGQGKASLYQARAIVKMLGLHEDAEQSR